MRLFFLISLIGILATSCSSSKKLNDTPANFDNKSISGDINVYSYTGYTTVTKANGRGVNVVPYTYYKIQKGGGEKLALTSKNLSPMLDNYEPAVNILNKYNSVNTGHKIWGTVNLIGVLGGIAMITVGTINAKNGVSSGGKLLLAGFGVEIVDAVSYAILNKAKNKNTTRLLDAIKLYNSRKNK